MLSHWPLAILLTIAAVVVVTGLLLRKIVSHWIQAYMSDANVSMKSLITMSFLRVDSGVIVAAKILARQGGVSERVSSSGVTTEQLLTHSLAGGNVGDVVTSLILADRAQISLDFESAAAFDLAGRDILDAVRTSILPKVIRCPPDTEAGSLYISGLSKDGIELQVRARVTVRTNMSKLIGGATDATIVARIGQSIIGAIGASETHLAILVQPTKIANYAMQQGVDVNTAYSIISIDIASINIGANVGARLTIDQAITDMKVAQADAEGRRCNAIADIQRMRALVAEREAAFILASATIPRAIADAIETRQRTKRPRQHITKTTV